MQLNPPGPIEYRTQPFPAVSRYGFADHGTDSESVSDPFPLEWVAPLRALLPFAACFADYFGMRFLEDGLGGSVEVDRLYRI